MRSQSASALTASSSDSGPPPGSSFLSQPPGQLPGHALRPFLRSHWLLLLSHLCRLLLSFPPSNPGPPQASSLSTCFFLISLHCLEDPNQSRDFKCHLVLMSPLLGLTLNSIVVYTSPVLTFPFECQPESQTDQVQNGSEASLSSLTSNHHLPHRLPYFCTLPCILPGVQVEI